MPPAVLVSSPAGDPENPATWSGTPVRLITALRETARIQPIAWSSRLQGAADRWARRADALLGLEHAFIHGPVRRQIAGAQARNAARRAGCCAQLHLGTYDLAPGHSPVPHFLFVDNSYDLWERDARSARHLSRWQRTQFRRLELSALRRVRHIFTIGQHVATNFIEVMGVPSERVTAVGTGTGGVRSYRGPKDYTRGRLLTVVKARPRDKGLPLLLDAFSLARQQRPDLELTVVGGAAFAEAPNRAGVRCTGRIPQDELQALYESATLYVMPATYEPWGLAYLEALACRVPIVGLARNALPEITDNGRYGFLLEQPSAAGLAQMLLDALKDPGRLERMGADGQAYCLQQYNWTKTAELITDILLQTQP